MVLEKECLLRQEDISLQEEERKNAKSYQLKIPPPIDFLRNRFMRYFLIYIIQFYRSYLAAYKLPTCKYYPTCSEYAIQAIKTKGAVKGGLMALWRLLRCNPFSKGGYDPA